MRGASLSTVAGFKACGAVMMATLAASCCGHGPGCALMRLTACRTMFCDSSTFFYAVDCVRGRVLGKASTATHVTYPQDLDHGVH